MSLVKKLTSVTTAAILVAPIALSFAPLAFAEDGENQVNVGVNMSAGIKSMHSDEETEATSSMMEDENEMHASSSMKGEVHASSSWMMDGNATTTGEQEREQHQSKVAAQVQLLLQAANRDGGIGEEVRAIAHEYASTTAKMDDEKSHVEGRPAWITFLIGTDYKNLGGLRSDIVTTQNQIDRLSRAASSTTDLSVKADLEAQIKALQDSASTTASFVADNESKFSLFGWFFHLLSK